MQTDRVKQRLGIACLRPYPEPPDSALAFLIIPFGTDHPAAIFTAGVSSCLLVNDACRNFYDLVIFSVTNAVLNARACEEGVRKTGDAPTRLLIRTGP